MFTGTKTVAFAANMGAGTGANLAASANNAIAAALALSGNPATAWVAAQFTFAGRTYVAIDQAGRLRRSRRPAHRRHWRHQNDRDQQLHLTRSEIL